MTEYGHRPNPYASNLGRLKSNLKRIATIEREVEFLESNDSAG